MRYLLGSGYVDNGGNRVDFARIWIDNIERYARPSPSRIVAISANGAQLPFTRNNLDEIHLSGDLGSCGALLNGSKKHHFNGWMGTVLALALIAYCDESDLIYLEQDALAFGEWVERLYADIGEAGVLFGNYKHQACAQSLFMVRHSYIPTFVRLILGGPPQNTAGQLGERVFANLEAQNPKDWKRFTWGFDRDRPEQGFSECKGHVWYVQQLTQSEMNELKVCGLI